jgi:hypothetical protein
MDLRRRLARLDRLTRKPGTEPPAGGPARAEVPGAGHGGDGWVVALGLSREETASGPLWVRDDRHVCAPPPGPLPDLRGLVSDPPPAGTAWSDILLLDLETTGLAGGTGTLPFLVGLAWWQDGGLVTRQLFLEVPGREAPLLADVMARATGRQAVVTYNGASFDLPLLRTRARLARRDDPCAALRSCDLLVAARRLWGRRLPDCRQQTVERDLRGRHRGGGDIDGALIPAAYHAFLRDGSPSLLPQVLRHNRRDLVGLAEILVAVAGVAADLAGPADRDDPAGGRPVPWPDAWSRALVCERRRDSSAAAAWATRMLEAGPADLPATAVRDAVRLLKRVEDWPRIERALAAGLQAWPDDARLHYEAAVLYEHRLGDRRRALQHARILGDPVRLARLEARVGPGTDRPGADRAGCGAVSRRL